MCAAALHAGAASATPKPFTIRAQPLASALLAFSDQANLSVSYSDVDISALKAKELIGQAEPDEALRRLLAGTGLGFRFVDSASVRIFHLAAVSGPAPTDAEELPSRGSISEVTVTATKRTERLQDTATSAAVVADPGLWRGGIADTAGLDAFIAGFSTTNLGPGRNKVFVRGLSDGLFVGRTQSAVGIYLDETPINFSAANPDLRLVDMQQIEVLRGPQGMLYGSGSIGGVYRMVTNKPDLGQAAGRIALAGSLTQGGKPNRSIDGMLNFPLVTDRIGLRLVGYFEGSGGYIDDVRLNERNINGSHVSGGRGMLRWELSDRWTLDLATTVQYIDQDDSQYFTAEAGPFKRDNYVSQPYSDRVIINTATIIADLGWANLISSTSIIDRDISAQYDATLAVPRFVALGGIASPFLSKRDIEMISHESRLTSTGGGAIRWLLGAFYLHTRETYDTSLTVPDAGDVFASIGFPSDIVHQESRDEGVTELALFGNLEWFLSDSFSVDVGARIFRNAFDVTSTTSGISVGGEAVAQGRRAQTDAVPKFVLSYRAADDLLIYLRAEEGYRTGGVNIDTPILAVPPEDDEPTSEVSVFRDDKLWNVEMGIKSEWLQGRLTVNAAVFYVNWKNIQTDQLRPTGLTYVTNAGNGRNLGGEIEVAAKPWPNLEVMVNLLANSPHLTTINSALGSEPGDELPGVSDLDAGAAVTYTFRVMNMFDGRISFTYTYVGKSNLFFDESNAATMGGYQLGTLVAAMTRGGLEFGISAKNLWNSRGNSFAFGNPFSLPFQHQVTPVQPRTVGVFANYQF